MKFHKTYFLRIIIFTLLVAIHFRLTAQSNKKYSSKFLIDIGGHYNYVFGNRYTDYYFSPDGNGFVGFTYVSSVHFHGGLLYSFQIKNHYLFETGFSYFNRTTYRIGNVDTVIKYSLISNPVIKDFQYSNNLEVPFFVGYKINVISLLIGTKMKVFSFFKIKEKLLNGSMVINKYNEGGFAFYPSIKIMYNFKIFKYHELLFYLGCDSRDAQNYDFQLGIELPFGKM